MTVESSITAPVEGAPSASTSTTGKSYGDILRSTSIIGGASLLNVGLSAVRAKCAAVWLGPAGVATMGLYAAITTTVSTLASVGISNSGVRQIAEAAGTGDQQGIGRTVVLLRRIALILGVTGALLQMVLALPLSRWTFGNDRHVLSLLLLSGVVLCTVVANAQMAFVQGLRRIGDLARINVWGAFLGTVLGIPIIYVWRMDGIVPLLTLVSATALLTSWWFARKAEVPRVAHLSWADTWNGARALLALGFAIMASGLMVAGVGYLTRLIVLRQLGLEEAGYYQAAQALSSVYVGFILSAMGTDFYPRLTAAAGDDSEVNRLVNEQAEVSLLLAVPGILATLALAPWVIAAFYSPEFSPANDVLRWQLLGILGRVMSWPIAFVLLAKGCSQAFFWTELIANGVHVALVWLGCRCFGLPGTGMGFFGLYVFYWIMMLLLMRRITHFRLSSANRRLILWVVLVVGLVFGLNKIVPAYWSMGLGVLAAGLTGLVCARRVMAHLPGNRLRSS